MTVRRDDALAVVTVGYNSAAHLPGTLAAVAPQLRDDDELVVVDNASRDGSLAGKAILGHFTQCNDRDGLFLYPAGSGS